MLKGHIVHYEDMESENNFFFVLKFVPDGNYANYESRFHFIFLLLLFVYIWHLEVLKRS